MEAHSGNPKKARELFRQGADKCEPHAPLFNAWAHFEARWCYVFNAPCKLVEAIEADMMLGAGTRLR